MLSILLLFSLSVLRPPRFALFPYTTLFRSTFAVLLLTGAALGDRFGRRKLFTIGLGIFTFASAATALRSEEQTSELQSRLHLVCRLLLEKKKQHNRI